MAIRLFRRTFLQSAAVGTSLSHLLVIFATRSMLAKTSPM
jgi:hypothetical protein